MSRTPIVIAGAVNDGRRPVIDWRPINDRRLSFVEAGRRAGVSGRGSMSSPLTRSSDIEVAGNREAALPVPRLHHSLQSVTSTLLPAGMVARISASVPGRLRRLTFAVTKAKRAVPPGAA
jgi:hypothetical protein